MTTVLGSPARNELAPGSVVIPSSGTELEIGPHLAARHTANLYLATDPERKPVVVKAFHEDYPGSRVAQEIEAWEIFGQEEGFVAYVGSGEYDSGRGGIPFLATEYAENGALAERNPLRRWPGTIHIKRNLFAIEGVAKALAVMHETGFVSRDISPSNIVVDRDGNGLVCDLGAVTERRNQSDPDMESTMSEELEGSLAYMAPEAMVGSVDPKIDIFSLGSTLYRIVAGQMPFPVSKPVEYAKKVLSEEPVNPKKINPKVPVELGDLIMRCLDKDPDRRPAAVEAQEEIAQIHRDLARMCLV